MEKYFSEVKGYSNPVQNATESNLFILSGRIWRLSYDVQTQIDN